jgi:hypothetical protein
VFGLPAKQIHAMLDVGTTVALSRLFPAADGLPAQPGGSYLVRSSTRPGAGGQHRTAAKRRRRDLGLDHAYAITSYAVQGATRALSTSRIDPTATRAEAYVDITRGQTANHLYLTRPADPLDGEALPSIPPPPIDDAVTRRLARSNGELTAWELHQATHERALQRRVDAIGL